MLICWLMKVTTARTGIIGALSNGLLSNCRVVVLEDDAQLVHGFTEKVTDWLARFPDDMLSFISALADRRSIRCR
jgi:hypothetical protein